MDSQLPCNDAFFRQSPKQTILLLTLTPSIGQSAQPVCRMGRTIAEMVQWATRVCCGPAPCSGHSRPLLWCLLPDHPQLNWRPSPLGKNELFELACAFGPPYGSIYHWKWINEALYISLLWPWVNSGPFWRLSVWSMKAEGKTQDCCKLPRKWPPVGLSEWQTHSLQTSNPNSTCWLVGAFP